MTTIESAQPIGNKGPEDPLVEQLDLARVMLQTGGIQAGPSLTHSLAEYIRDGVMEAQSVSVVPEVKDAELVDPTDKFFDSVEEGLKDRSLIPVLRDHSRRKTPVDKPTTADAIARRGILGRIYFS